jgi:hypothetical protein
MILPLKARDPEAGRVVGALFGIDLFMTVSVGSQLWE